MPPSRRGPFASALALTLALAATPALASAETPTVDGPIEVAAAPGDEATTTAASFGDADGTDDKAWSASLTAQASVGIGTFAAEPQTNELVVTSFLATGAYKLSDAVSVGAGLGLTWFQVVDFGTALQDHELLLSDLYFSIGHSSIYRHEDSGFNVSGAFRVYLPTSLASQFQNRMFTLRPTLSASIPVGPVSFSYTLGFGKFFNLSAVPTVDCDDFDRSAECIEGRDQNPEFGFESERRGAEVYLPGSGTNSFYVLNSLRVGWTIVDGLSLSLGATLYNTFGVRSLRTDAFSSENATEGRSQTDRLITQFGISYQVIRELTVGLSLTTDTVRPLGERGDDLVVFDFARAPDNITSLNLSLTGTL